MSVAGGGRGYPGESARHAALPEVVAAATAPGDEGAVALQGQAVKVAGGDRGHAGEAARHAALPGAGGAAPGDDGTVALQGQAVPETGGDCGYAREAARHAALPVVAEATAPGDDGAVPVIAATGAAPGHRPTGRGRLRRARREEQPEAQRDQSAELEGPRSRRQLDPPLLSRHLRRASVSRAMTRWGWDPTNDCPPFRNRLQAGLPPLLLASSPSPAASFSATNPETH